VLPHSALTVSRPTSATRTLPKDLDSLSRHMLVNEVEDGCADIEM
jgi:hypothetical protein